MNRIKVKCIVDVYNENSYVKNDIDIVVVRSHWNDDDFINIEIDDKSVCVNGDSLIKALKNCMNAK